MAVAVNGPIVNSGSRAPGYRNVLTSRIDATSGIVARAKGTVRRAIPEEMAIAMTRPSVMTGPVHSRTANATAAIAKAMTSLVVGSSLAVGASLAKTSSAPPRETTSPAERRYLPRFFPLTVTVPSTPLIT